MASFYNAETSEPVSVMYIASSGKGNVVLKAPAGLGMRVPEVVVSNGRGVAKADPALNPKPGEYRWTFTGLTEGSSILALDSQSRILAQIPVRRLDSLESYKSITQRFNRRGMKIDLDSHIDYVCYASEIVGDGVAFRPKSATEFKLAITDTQLFHHDDRSDHFGKLAAAATVGEGYREVSTPSLHVAISEALSSVHIDSYAFMIRGGERYFRHFARCRTAHIRRTAVSHAHAVVATQGHALHRFGAAGAAPRAPEFHESIQPNPWPAHRNRRNRQPRLTLRRTSILLRRLLRRRTSH